MKNWDNINVLFQKLFGDYYLFGPPAESIHLETGLKYRSCGKFNNAGPYRTPNGLTCMVEWCLPRKNTSGPSIEKELDLGQGCWVGPCATVHHFRHLALRYWVYLPGDYFSS